MNTKTFIELATTLEKSNLSQEDKIYILSEIAQKEKMIELNKELLILFRDNMSKHKFQKVFSKYQHTDSIQDLINPATIRFKKYDGQEMKNRIIRSAVKKNILGEEMTITENLFLEGCITFLEQKGSNTLTDLVDILSHLYELASEDVKENSNVLEDMLKKFPSAEHFKLFLEQEPTYRKSFTLNVLNRTKDYKNVGKEEYILNIRR